jgi:hypothetical protein
VLTVNGRVADDPAVPVARAGGSGVRDGQRRHHGLSVRERHCDQGSTLIVGMQLNAHGKRSGAAYVFERRQGAWAEVTRLSSTGSAR